MKKTYLFLIVLFLCFQAQAQNETCDTALDLATLTSPFDGTTAGAVNDNLINCNNAGNEIANTSPDLYYSIMVPAGSTITIAQTVNGYDSTNIAFYGDCTNRTVVACFDDPDTTSVVWANNTGSDQTFYWIQDGFNGGSGTFTLSWSIIPCTNATAAFSVVSDCANGEQFLVNVNVTDIGSATSITISDDQGSVPQSLTAAGTVQFGPFVNNSPVVITISNDQSSDCSLTSPVLNQLACPPANDNCDAAIALTVNTDFLCGVVTPGSLIGATDSGEGDNGAGTPDDDVWYSFTATAVSHRISLTNVAGTPTDLVHQILEGTCNGGLTSLLISDANTSNFAGFVPGNTYFVRIFSFGAVAGNTTFDVCVGTPPPPPANDTCDGAIDLATLTSPLSDTTQFVFNDSLTNCNNNGEEVANLSPDMYYYIMVPNGSTLRIRQTANNYDSTNTVFYGDCSNRTTIACFDDPDDTQVIWANNTGTDQNVFWIQDGYNGNSGTFTLEWSVVACINAEAAYTVVSDCANGDQFLIDVDITNLGSATSVSITDDQGSAANASSTGIVQMGPYPNNTPVTIIITNEQDGDCFITSPVLNQIACPPANDNCVDAVELTINEDLGCGVVTNGTLLGATNSGEGDNGEGDPDDDVWYFFTATNNTLTISLLNVTGTPVNLVHEVLTGTCDGGLTSVFISNPDSSTIGNLVVGATYYVRIFTFGSAAGATTAFDVCIGTPPMPPANDDCANAEVLTVNEDESCAAITSGTLVSATNSGEGDNGAGDPDDDVWYTFTATATAHKFTISNIAGTPVNVVHEVLQGTCGGGLTSVSLSDPNTSTVNGLTIGQTYYVRVFSNATGAGGSTTFDICVGLPPTPPANDDCDTAAEVIVGSTAGEFITDGTNVAATLSAQAAPTVCGGFSGGDVWYTLTVPPSGNVTIETLNSSVGETGVDTVVTVYSGTCSALTQVDCDDDDAASGAYSLVNLTGQTPGDVLYLRVYEYGNNNEGGFGVTAYDASLGTNPFEKGTFSVYPNPVKNILNLSYTRNITNVAVYNLIGQQVIVKNVNANESQIDMSNLAGGTYIVKVTADNEVKTIKVIKS